MIASLRGRVASRLDGYIVVDVGGVGYGVHVTAPLAASLRDGEEVELHVHTHVREDALQLFGFPARLELEVFLALDTVTGIGPKLAMSILSGTSVGDLLEAVSREDVKRLTRVPGIGKKTAQRILVELKEVFARFLPDARGDEAPSPERDPGVLADVSSALANLGFRASDIDRALHTIEAMGESPSDFEGLFRKAMQLLR